MHICTYVHMYQLDCKYVCTLLCEDCWLVHVFINTLYMYLPHHSLTSTDCVRVMQKKPNKNKTEDATQSEQVTIVTVPITKVEESPMKGGTVRTVWPHSFEVHTLYVSAMYRI